jgi:lysosomal alpha-mannosidase
MGYLSIGGNAPPSFQFCEYLNISVCPVSETDSFNVMSYNPIGRKNVGVFALPVNNNSFQVLDESGAPVVAQVMPVSEATRNVRRDRGKAPYVLVWGGMLRGLGSDLFLVRPAKSGRGTTVLTKEYTPRRGEDFFIENGMVNLTFDGTMGRLKFMENIVSKISTEVVQNFLWWNSSAGNNVNSSQASGAYIFRPNGTSPFEINGSMVDVSVIKGPLVTEVRQKWSSWLYQSIILYKDSPVVTFEYTVGPIPFKDGLGKEIVSRFTTNLETDSKFYTDANGRQMLERVRNFRPTWDYNNTEPVAGNYYPVDSRIFMKDEKRGVQFTVMTDRAQGGSSLNDGQLELMVHRRMFHDDGRGVGEPLNETGQFGDGLVVRGRHFVILDNFINSTIYHRTLGETLLLTPQVALTPSDATYDDWVKKYPPYYYGLVEDLPLNVHLLTLERLDNAHHILRLEHQVPIDEAPLNFTVNLTLDGMFSLMKVVESVELGLGGNAALTDIARLHWNTDSSRRGHRVPRQPVGKMEPPFKIELRPMEIRTFYITVEYYPA